MYLKDFPFDAQKVKYNYFLIYTMATLLLLLNILLEDLR